MLYAYLSRALCLALIFAFSKAVYSQKIAWEKSYGGLHSDYLSDAIPTADYGFIVAGSSLSKRTGTKTEAHQGDYDYWVWKMDEHGTLVWQRSYGSTQTDVLQRLILTPDGGYLLVGTSASSPSSTTKKTVTGVPFKDGQKKHKGFGGDDIWILKLDATGQELWQKTLGGSGQEKVSAVLLDKEGGYIIGGSSSSDGGLSPEDGIKKEDGFGNMDYWVVALDAKGGINWQKTIGGIFADELHTMLPLASGGYLLGGTSNSPLSGNKVAAGYGGNDFWLVSLDAAGNITQQQVLGGEGDDVLQVMLYDKKGELVLGGTSSSEISGTKTSNKKNNSHLWLLKGKDMQEMLWQETYAIGKTDLMCAAFIDDDGSLLIGGYTTGKNNPSKKPKQQDTQDYVLLKIAPTGKELWQKRVGSQDTDLLKKVIPLRDGGYLMLGTSTSVNTITSKGKESASGDRKSIIGREDFWVVKLQDENKKPVIKHQLEAFPNPATAYTQVVLGYDCHDAQGSVYDLAGRQVLTFAVEGRTTPVNLSGLPQGVYVIEVKSEVSTDAIKVMKKD